MTTNETARQPHSDSAGPLGVGIAIGLVLGSAVWAAYFVQASVWTGLPLSVVVGGGIVLVAGASLALGVARPRLTRACIGVAVGAVLTLPIAFALIIAMFDILNLE